jgi:NAD(P)-dependent dehydrogenase (short-subunit alcohol dehydrogenase family)
MAAILTGKEGLAKFALSAILNITLSAIILENLTMTSTKTWFITGASRGFGRVWTEAALGRGDRVAATARNPQALDELVTAYGDAVLALPLDVTDRNAVFEAVGQAHRHFGRLDVILSNAGYG